MRLSLFVPCDPTADHSSVPPARNWCPWRAPPEACAGGRREGDILLCVLPKSRGQQFRVRSAVRARLTSGLEAPLRSVHHRTRGTTVVPACGDFRLLDFQGDMADRLRGVEGKDHDLLTRLPGDPAGSSLSPMLVEGMVHGRSGVSEVSITVATAAMLISPGVWTGIAGCGLMICLRTLALPCGSKPIVIVCWGGKSILM